MSFNKLNPFLVKIKYNLKHQVSKLKISMRSDRKHKISSLKLLSKNNFRSYHILNKSGISCDLKNNTKNNDLNLEFTIQIYGFIYTLSVIYFDITYIDFLGPES